MAGPGTSPLTISGSRVYLTGPYDGKPFGLSIVTPAQAGPFVLAGNADNGTKVVRTSIAVDPHTGALTVTSDPLPQALNGIPLDMRAIHIDVDRPGFTFNPTNCDVMSVAAVLASATGTVSKVSHPFPATGCAACRSSRSSPSRRRARRVIRTARPCTSRSHRARARRISRKPRSTSQHSCPRGSPRSRKRVWTSLVDANPASCAATSVVGSATAVTPAAR